MKKLIRRVVCERDTAGGVVLWLAIAGLAFCITLGASLSWLSGHHLVQTEKGLVVVSKRYISLKNTKVDIRNWKWDDAKAHPELCEALLAAGYEDLLPEPPPEPTLKEKALARLKEWKEKTVEYSTNTWSKVKTSVEKTEKPDEKLQPKDKINDAL